MIPFLCSKNTVHGENRSLNCHLTCCVVSHQDLVGQLVVPCEFSWCSCPICDFVEGVLHVLPHKAAHQRILHQSMDWFKGNFTGKPHIEW